MDYIKKEVQELANKEIARLQENLSCILAENTNNGFKQLLVNGAGRYIVRFNGVETVNTNAFGVACQNYLKVQNDNL